MSNNSRAHECRIQLVLLWRYGLFLTVIIFCSLLQKVASYRGQGRRKGDFGAATWFLKPGKGQQQCNLFTISEFSCADWFRTMVNRVLIDHENDVI